jgi:hypothetical protein
VVRNDGRRRRAFALLDEIEAVAAKAAMPDLAEPVWQAAETRETNKCLPRSNGPLCRRSICGAFARASWRALLSHRQAVG